MAVLIAVNMTLQKIEKPLQMRIWYPWMSQLATTVNCWRVVGSFIVVFRDIVSLGLNSIKKDRPMD